MRHKHTQVYRRSLVVRAAGTRSGGRGFESHIGHDGDFFCDLPKPRVSSAQAQWVGQLNH